MTGPDARKLADELTEAARHKSYWSMDDQLLVLRAAAALRSPQPGMPSREEVARIIDATPFDGVLAVDGSLIPVHMPIRKAEALVKADAILSLSHEAPAQDDGRVPERETWWLIEREGCGLYTTAGFTTSSGWTDDPWRAYRYKTAKEADDARLMLLSLRDESVVTEHVFINKRPREMSAPIREDRVQAGSGPARLERQP